MDGGEMPADKISESHLWSELPKHRLLADVSLWSADLGALGEEVRRIEPAADLFHLDVADAHFVPALLFFPDLIRAIRPLTTKPFHVHLMVERPDSLVEEFVQAGANLVTLHLECRAGLELGLNKIAAAGAWAGIAVQLETNVSDLVPYLDRIQLIVFMGTLLGIKGVSLDERVLQKIRAAKRLLTEHGLADRIKVSADGGIRVDTVPRLREAGADLITPGSLFFKSQDLEETVTWFRSL
jgi:ribulose-phosphate 3-epimerase